mmetsp:Transcript_31149/g.89372  ORF Transcript_31149/g.89372 Transcript_31149/m.89372 type:complete len:430 (-) Transcript_31149:106-1395(-)
MAGAQAARAARSRGTLAACAVLGLCALYAGAGSRAARGAAAWVQQAPPSRASARSRSSRRQLRALGGESEEAQLHGPYPAPRDDVAWKDLGFGLTTKETKVAITTCPRGGEWSAHRVEPYGPLQMEPAATILNYGQGVFEGMKAFRTAKGRIALFRPQMNARRMASGAERFLMPPVPEELFLSAVSAAVRANAEWIPPAGDGEFYLRPLLIGSGGTLGVGPSTEFTFVIYGAPVGKYFKGGGARMRIEAHHQRAAPKGVGDVKAAGNYAPCFSAQKEARDAGYSDVIYLDVTGQHIEEAAASNFFALGEDGVLRTPALGTILPGVTRDSVIQLAKRLAASGKGPIREVQEGEVSLEHILQAKEAFVTGTGAGISPVAHVALPEGKEVDLEVPGAATKLIQDALREIQLELAPDEFGWLWDPFEAMGSSS